MDWSPFVPVLTALIAAGATLGGVALTQASAAKREARLAADRRHDEEIADLRTEARRVSDLFLAESIAYERIASETRDKDDFDVRYEAHLYSETLYRLGQAINMLPDADARSVLRMLVNNLSDYHGFPSALLGIDNWEVTVPTILFAALDISSAYARGEKPDLDNVRRFRQIEAASAEVNASIAEAKAMHPAYLARQARTGAEGQHS